MTTNHVINTKQNWGSAGSRWDVTFNISLKLNWKREQWHEGEIGRNDHLNCVWLDSGCEGSALWNTNKTRRHSQQRDTVTIFLSVIHLSLFFSAKCCLLALLCYLVSSLVFYFGIAGCPVLFVPIWSDVFTCAVLSHTTLDSSVALSSIKRETCHWANNPLSVPKALSLQRLL